MPWVALQFVIAEFPDHSHFVMAFISVYTTRYIKINQTLRIIHTISVNAPHNSYNTCNSYYLNYAGGPNLQ